MRRQRAGGRPGATWVAAPPSPHGNRGSGLAGEEPSGCREEPELEFAYGSGRFDATCVQSS
eukprot:1717486-Alexandrium_andersonii.AAC.1